MARTILIDANVIEQIGRGNQQAADALRNMRARGDRVYVTQQAYNEMVNSPAIPRTGVAKREFLRDMNIQIAPPGNAAERGAALGANSTRGGNAILGPGDIQVAAHARGINGEVWSFDRGFRNNGNAVRQTLGVQVAQECSLPLGNAPEDYRVARRLARLPEIEIDLSGTVRRPGGGSSGGGGGGPFRRVSPPAGRLGGVKALGGGLAMLAMNILANLIVEKIERSRMEKAIAKLDPDIQSRLEGQAVTALEIQSGGGKAFGIVTIVIVEQTTMNLASGNMMTGMVEVELMSVTVGDKEQNKKGQVSTERTPLGNLANHPYTFSFELTPFPREQVDVYRALKQELVWYEDQVKTPTLASEDRTRLSLDKLQLERKINDWLHPPPPNYSDFNPPIAIKLEPIYLKTGIENIYGWWWVNMDGGIWCYYFARNKTVRWYDIYNHRTGQGKWSEKGGAVEVLWASGTRELWPFEIVPSNQKGTSTAGGKTSTFTAVRVWNAAVAKIVGRWKMNCDKWMWNIDFNEDGTVRWSDYYNAAMNGSGTWHLTKDGVYLMWASGSRDEWTFSSSGSAATGRTTVDKKPYSFDATKTG